MVGVCEALESVEVAVAGLEAAVAGGCGDPEVAVRLRGLVDRVEGACTRVLAGFAASGPQLPGRFLTLGGWWTDRAHATRSEAGARLAAQNVLDELPVFAAALADGRVGQAHLRMLAPAVTDRRRELACRDDEVLTEAAVTLDPSRFRRVVARWESLADDELGDPTRPELVCEKRRLRLVLRQDGSWWLDGVLEPLVGEALQTALDAAMGPPARDDNRSGRQRRHDALADVVNAVLCLPDRPVVGGMAAQVSVIVEASSGTATTAAGIVLPSWERDYLLCCSDVTTVLVTVSGEPFDVGGPYKMIPGRTRRAVIARDRRCRFPGCDCPAKWCDVHHLIWKSHHGDNRLENLSHSEYLHSGLTARARGRGFGGTARPLELAERLATPRGRRALLRCSRGTGTSDLGLDWGAV